MLILYNLATRESRFIKHPVLPSSEEILLTAEEPLTELLDLQNAWLQDFPGDSHAITTLRNDLIRADWLRRRARTVLQQFQLDLHLTGMPMQYWDRLVQHQIRFLEKHAAHTQNEFRKAFRLLQSQKPAQTKPETPPKPKNDYGDHGAIFQQTIKVRIIDGKTITETDPKNEEFLEPELMKLAGVIWRNFCFYDGIPEEYAWVTRNDGIDHGPYKHILITYSPEEFREICRRELETNAEHLLDGKRCGYQHLGRYHPDTPRAKSGD